MEHIIPFVAHIFYDGVVHYQTWGVQNGDRDAHTDVMHPEAT